MKVHVRKMHDMMLNKRLGNGLQLTLRLILLLTAGGTSLLDQIIVIAIVIFINIVIISVIVVIICVIFVINIVISSVL